MVRAQRTGDKSTRDAKFAAAEADRQRVRLEEEVKGYEEKVQVLRQDIDQLVSGVTPALRNDY